MDELNDMEIEALRQASTPTGIDPTQMDDFMVTVIFPLIEAGLLESGFPIRITSNGRDVLDMQS